MMDLGKVNADQQVIRSAHRRWHDLLTRSVRGLRRADALPLSEVKLRLLHLVDLVGLGWSHLKESRKTVSVSVPSNFSFKEVVPKVDFKGFSDVVKTSDESPAAKRVRETLKEESLAWYEKKDRYARFFLHVRRLLAKASKTEGPRLGASASLEKCVATLARLTETTFTKEQLRSPRNGHMRFARLVLVSLGKSPDLAAVEKKAGGLSYLLADVEVKLGVRCDKE